MFVKLPVPFSVQTAVKKLLAFADVIVKLLPSHTEASKPAVALTAGTMVSDVWL